MIEKTILDYLNGVLSVPCYMERPDVQIPTSYVVIEKTGGTIINQVERATLAVQAYAGTMYDAATLNEAVKAAMLNSISLGSISSCKLNSNYNYTDTSTKQYRYQSVWDVVFY